MGSDVKKKICVVTASRSEYGLLRWLMEEIKNDAQLELQIIVTGSHLSPEFGLTYQEIEKDGFFIDEKVEMLLSANTKVAIAKSMGLCSISISKAFEKLKPDLVVVLGDRYELLSVCSTAVVMNIPIAHISGGDITEGAIDDMIRHAITKMACLHFPGTEESARRIIQMGEEPRRVFNVGEPCLDNFKRLQRLSRKELSYDLGFNEEKKWILMTYHPETMLSIEDNLKIVNNLIAVLTEFDNFQILITYPNADYGSKEIIEILIKTCINNPEIFKMVKNLGQQKYISFMQQAYCIIGNSSSGIVESPFLRIPCINIGKRQKGRVMSGNIITIEGDIGSLRAAFLKLNDNDFKENLKKFDNIYGDEDTAIRIKNILKSVNFKSIQKKEFFDYADYRR